MMICKVEYVREVEFARFFSYALGVTGSEGTSHLNQQTATETNGSTDAYNVIRIANLKLKIRCV